jgi:hypothetical protein
MLENVQQSKLWLYLGLVLSFVLAYAIFSGPTHQMPIDYGWAIHWSCPLCVLWSLLATALMMRFGKRSLWVFLGLPLASYWPIWLLTHQLPSCFATHNCA